MNEDARTTGGRPSVDNHLSVFVLQLPPLNTQSTESSPKDAVYQSYHSWLASDEYRRDTSRMGSPSHKTLHLATIRYSVAGVTHDLTSEPVARPCCELPVPGAHHLLERTKPLDLRRPRRKKPRLPFAVSSRDPRVQEIGRRIAAVTELEGSAQLLDEALGTDLSRRRRPRPRMRRSTRCSARANQSRSATGQKSPPHAAT